MTPARWLVLRVQSPSGDEASGLLAEGLLALGGRAVWEDGGLLTTHVPEPYDPEAFVARAGERLAGLCPGCELETSWQAHEDWAETWKRGLVPRRLTERLWVTPSWERPATRPGDVVVTVDPGMAFGTAEHGTTRGCLRLLDTALRSGDRVLDLGAGSGVLSIAAALLGASRVVAVEGDPLAVETLEENLERNGVANRVVVQAFWATGGSLGPLGPFTGILANLEASILGRLLPAIAASLEPGGWAVLSGVGPAESEAVLEQAGADGLALEAVDDDEGWRSVLLRSL